MYNLIMHNDMHCYIIPYKANKYSPLFSYKYINTLIGKQILSKYQCMVIDDIVQHNLSHNQQQNNLEL